MINIICLIGFVAFQFLTIYVGQKGLLGFSIGYAVLSVSFVILLMGSLILEKIDRLKKKETA